MSIQSKELINHCHLNQHVDGEISNPSLLHTRLRQPVSASMNILILLGCSLLVAACGGAGGGGGSGVGAPINPTPNTNTSATITTDAFGLTTALNTKLIPSGSKFLVWSEEFNGSSLDSNLWFSETGDGSQYGLSGWGNNELQWYLPANATVAAGKLTITTKKETQNGYDYNSARIITRDKFAFRYGRIEASIRLPAGQGIWPAFWLLPQASPSPYGTWAASGEIDIMEAVNPAATGGNTIYGTIHYGGQFPANVFSGEQFVAASSITANFHSYALEWDEFEIRWYLDDELYAVRNTWSSTGGAFPAPFNEPFYILLNTAVGGNFPGAPNASTAVTPVTMEVDYIRVYSGD